MLRLLVAGLAATTLIVATTGSAAARADHSLSIRGEINHLFSQASNGHGGTLGFDSNRDGRIAVLDEDIRDDRDGHSAYDAHHLLQTLDGKGGRRNGFVYPVEARTFFRKFDRNHDGKLSTRNGEFRRTQIAVYGGGRWYGVPHGYSKGVSPLAFEQKIF